MASQLQSKTIDNTPPPPPATTCSSTALLILKILAAAFTLTAAVVIATAKQTVHVFGITFDAHFDEASSLRFLLGSNSVVCAFSALSLLFILFFLTRPGPGKNVSFEIRFLLYLHDLAMTVLMISGCAAASAVGYVGKFGEEKMGWFRLCDRVDKFCNQMTVSLVLSYFAFFCYFAITIISARNFMYEAAAAAAAK